MAAAGRRPSFLGRTAIAGVGYTPFTRKSGKSVLALAADACRAAIADAGLDPQAVNGVASYALGDSVPSQSVATVLGLPTQRYVLDLNLGGQAPSFMVMHAAMAVETGLADYVVAYRALNGRSGQRVGSTLFGGPAAQYRYPIGFTAYPQYMAMWARRYMIETGATEEDLAAVPIAQRRYAALNDRAILKTPLTLEDYFAQPYVAEPYRIADCTSEVDGACAVVVTSLANARTLAQRPAIIRGAAYALGPHSGLDIGDGLLWDDFSRNYTSFLADELWSSAEMRPKDVDFAEIYDCFSSTVLIGLEGLGLVGRGEAGGFYRSGASGQDGSLPVNTSGGLLCEGYLHGMNVLAEAVLQIQGRGGARQVKRNGTCVVTSGGMMDGSALVLERD